MLLKKIGMLSTFLDSALLPQLSNGLYGEGGDGMSVLIKDMSIPKSCHTCKLMLLSPCQCALTGKSYNQGLGRRPRDCPLVEVELIDQEELITPLNMIGGYLRRVNHD